MDTIIREMKELLKNEIFNATLLKIDLKSPDFREAKLNGHICPQHMYYKPDIWIGQEDCLWLNVYTRDLGLFHQKAIN